MRGGRKKITCHRWMVIVLVFAREADSDVRVEKDTLIGQLELRRVSCVLVTMAHRRSITREGGGGGVLYNASVDLTTIVLYNLALKADSMKVIFKKNNNNINRVIGILAYKHMFIYKRESKFTFLEARENSRLRREARYISRNI